MGSWGHTAFQVTKCPIFRKQPVRFRGSPWLLLQIPRAKQNFPEQLGQAGASSPSRFTPGARTDNILGLILCWPEASNSQQETPASLCTCPHTHPCTLPHPTHPQPHKSGNPGWAVSSGHCFSCYLFWHWNLLKFSFLLNSRLNNKQ